MSLVVGCVWVFGCGSGSTPQPVLASATLSQQLAEAYCTQQHACCPGGSVPDDAGQSRDGGASTTCLTATASAATDGGAGAGCVARAELAASQQLALISTAFGEGLVSINNAVVAGCVSAYAARACGAVTQLNVDEALGDPGCAGIFTGYIPLGERCDMTVECAAGGYCLAQATGQPITSFGGGGTLGVCYPYQQAGDACNATADCLPPLTCSATMQVCQ